MERRSGNPDSVDLRRNAHRHDTIVQDIHPVVSLETTDTVGTYQNLLRSGTVTYQQTIPVDLYYHRTHYCHYHHLTSVLRKHCFPYDSLCDYSNLVRKNCPVYANARTGRYYLNFQWQYISSLVQFSPFWEYPVAAHHP